MLSIDSPALERWKAAAPAADGTSMPAAEAQRPITVLQIVPTLETGGAERSVLEVAQALVGRGDRAIVVSEGGRMVDDLIAAGAVHHLMPVASKNPLRMWANSSRLAALIAAERADIVHVRSRAPAWSALWASRRAKVPLVTTYHGIYSQRGPLKGLYNSVMARGDVVIANSAFTAALIERRHPFARDRIRTIHRGLDLAAFADPDAGARGLALKQAWGVGPRDRVILHLARLTSWKGHDVLVEALDRLCRHENRDWVAILAGDDQGRSDYRRSIERLIADKHLSAQVRLVGHCDDVPAAMAAADLVVVPSTRAEAFGRAAIEAQAAQVPVIVSDLGAVGETVLAPPDVPWHLRSGWRVPAGEPEALAEAILEAITSTRDTRLEIGARGRAHVASLFSVEAMTGRTLAAYRSILRP